MALSLLSQASAFNPGSDLWIVPDLDRSPWTARLDWYLNFQICKSSRHKKLELPEQLKNVLKETDLDQPAISPSKDPALMISSDNLLPSKWVVVLPWKDDLELWSSQIFQIWSQLKEPSLRVFLPPGQSTGNLQTSLPSHLTAPDFTVVLD